MTVNCRADFPVVDKPESGERKSLLGEKTGSPQC